MNKFIFHVLINFIIICVVYGQHHSVHKYENEFYKKNFTSSITYTQQLSKNSSSAKLNKIVFGYLPYWEFSAGTHKIIRYDLLSHLAVFSYEADSLGNLKDPYGWPWNDVIFMAKSNNVKLILAVTNFDGNSINKLITNQSHKEKLFSNLLQRVKAYSFDGINIDFEEVNKADRNTVISNFFAELKNYFIQNKLNIEISFASPIVNWGGWDFSMIAKQIDLFFIMGYDFYGTWSSTTGPSAPLVGGNYNITTSFSFDYYTVLQSNPEKLVLGVPYYGNYWLTKSSFPYSAGSDAKTKRYREVLTNTKNKEKLWDNSSKTPWIRWHDTTWNQIWYDDEESLELKYDLAIKNKIAGVGIWALGYDDGRSELWKLIENKFAATSNAEKNEIPSAYVLEQNYPNPFNPVTTIEYTIPAANANNASTKNHVLIKVYDALGREVVTLVDEYKTAGKYKVDFIPDSSIKNPTSSVYFYRMQSGSYSKAKKMVLLK